MPLLVVRHAVAVARTDWEGDDRLRPLTRHGRAQARVLGRWLALRAPTGGDPGDTGPVDRGDAVDVAVGDGPVDRPLLLSSPTERCLATLEPFAALSRGTIDERDELLAGRPGAARALCRPLLRTGAVVCTHGEVIPQLLDDLGVRPVGASITDCEKGSVWILTVAGGTVEGRYLAPATLAHQAG